MSGGKLTSRSFTNNLISTDLLHVVVTAVTTQSVYGSSYKSNISQVAGVISDCCLTTASFENGILYFYNSAGEVQIQTAVSLIYSGGSGSCINQLYVNDIINCNWLNVTPPLQEINVMPEQGQGNVFFGRVGNIATGAGLTIDVNNNTSPYKASFALNRSIVPANVTFELISSADSSNVRFREISVGSNPIRYESMIRFASLSSEIANDDNISQSFQTLEKNSIYSNLGTRIGHVGSSDTDETFGVAGDAFISSLSQSTELAISTVYSWLWNSGTSPVAQQVAALDLSGVIGAIRFYPGIYASAITTSSPITINGINNSNKILFGFVPTGESATSIIDISGSTGYNQLRLRTKASFLTPNNNTGFRGDFAWGNDNTLSYFIFIKVSDTSTGVHSWKKTQLFLF